MGNAKCNPGLIAAVAVGCVIALASGVTELRAQSSDGWIGSADSDETRFQLIERDLGGFGRSMWEVGDRYERLYQALLDENFDLAIHHWSGIRSAIQRGVVRRPGRAENAGKYLSDETWQQVRRALESRDSQRAWDGFSAAREACMNCHEAEKRSYLNDQPMFRGLTKPN